LKNLLPLAQAPELAYPELVKSGMVALLIGLMSHENVDIVIDVVEVLHELTDEDVGNEAEEEGDQESTSGALKMLIEALVSHCVLSQSGSY
jgi:beta-catenin-like protein 1